jgi:HK97 family phage major capsid protein
VSRDETQLTSHLNDMKTRVKRRNQRLFGLAIVLLAAVTVCFVPALLAAIFVFPKVAGGLALAAMAPVFPLRDPQGGEGGESESSLMVKVARAMESLDSRSRGQATDITSLKSAVNDLSSRTNELCKGRLQSLVSCGSEGGGRNTRIGFVSESCALEIASAFVAHCAASGCLESLSSSSSTRDSLMAQARSVLGITGKTALTTSDIPLPTVYGGEIRELISQFGVVRKAMFPYPIGMGIAKPARMGTRPAFASIALSAPFGELSPTITYASLESHKIGGLVRLPREIDEQSMVPMGQFLARYGAVEFARIEDTWGFLADGTADYESIKGVVQIARENSKTVTLAAGKTKPSDATLADFRALRRKVNKAALNGKIAAYYLDTTWETALSGFKTIQEPLVYQRLPDGSAILDGYPVVWTDVMQAYDTAGAADKPLAVFGALSFWWMGEHGFPRIDTSSHVFFSNDQLATRFIEEIDFDYCALDAAAALMTPTA